MRLSALHALYDATRQRSLELCRPLGVEDHVVQAMEDASPPKWHLGHTTWFFEAVLLNEFVPGYEPYDESLWYLFNSYYHSLGERLARPKRGVITRPSVAEVLAYREAVDERMRRLFVEAERFDAEAIAQRTTLGIHHEQQHQELLLTDTKYNLSCNPLYPAYVEAAPKRGLREVAPATYVQIEGGLVEIGCDPATVDFSYDHERPRHRVFLEPFAIADRLVTNGEYRAFVEDGGYSEPLLWLDDGWATVQREGWTAPLYWVERDGGRFEFTLHGLEPLDPAAPVCHLSFYEADAFARWAGKRLPTEAEWEHVAQTAASFGEPGAFYESGALHPTADAGGGDDGTVRQLLGTLWQHTGSAFRPYPGFSPEAGALAEYNGKFMANQMICRGGSVATPRDHLRVSYRNFFHCPKRWQFFGLRLAT